MSTINVTSKTSRDGEKKWYYFEWGKAASQRKATGIFTYVTCKNLVQRNFNKEALALLEIKRSQLILEHQALGTSYIPSHIFRNNFIDYYTQYVKNNKREGNRHLEGSLENFKKILPQDRILYLEITENLCLRFQKYLLDCFTGKTPSDYFAAFKRVIKTATKEGYFKTNPAEEIRSKTNSSKTLKEFLEADEYIKLLETPMYNQEIKEAFVVSCYTGLRFCDIKSLKWEDIQSDYYHPDHPEENK